MILTDRTAKQMECPLRSIGCPDPLKCLAEECPMWRQYGSGHQGYCGLAGMPEEVDLDRAYHRAKAQREAEL
mgnify:CR=1 FL=1